MTIVFFTLRSNPTYSSSLIEAILAHALKKLGANVIMVYGDDVLPSTDIDTVLYKGEWAHKLVGRLLGYWHKKALGIPWVNFKDLGVGGGEVDFSTRKDIYGVADTDRYAEMSIFRYFLSGKKGKTDEYWHKYDEKNVEALICAKAAYRIYYSYKPDVVIMLHGTYACWGSFREYMASRGVTTYSYEKSSHRFGYFRFTKDNNLLGGWEKHKEEIFVKASKVDKFFAKRVNAQTDDQLLFKKNRQDTSPLPYYEDKYYCLYPNIPWDAIVENNTSSVFRDYWDWIDKHIEYFKEEKNQRKLLIIKPHPGELVWEKTQLSIAKYIQDKYASLTPNITILPANTAFTAYSLQQLHPLNIVYNGTLGLELAQMDYPVLLACDDVHYVKALGIKHTNWRDNMDWEEYKKSYLDERTGGTLTSISNMSNLTAYAYHYFIRTLVRIPFYRKDKWLAIDWKKIYNYSWLDEDKPIMKIARRIMEKQEIENPL